MPVFERQRASTKEGLVTESFSRARHGVRARRSKLRKRVNNYGGCKTAPPAFLAAAKIAAIQARSARLSALQRDQA